ncbi:hypothetical protein [Actinoplanes sp. CA-252034]|uniref:hypothetical protein n=1 Tax=Actinoplanes sp. CA-252034 TaxID=3239906 RepID=UPI003D98F274
MLTVVLALGAAGLLMLLAARHLERRAAAPPDLDAGARTALRAEVGEALVRHGFVTSVRIYRERTGAGLLEAHGAVRRIARDGH